MDQHDTITSIEHWRNLVRANPWPLLIALLSILWLLLLIQWPASTPEEFELLAEDAPAELVLDASRPESFPTGAVITAKHIRVLGDVTLTSPAVIVANAIEFAPSARITIPSGQITVVAARIEHGVLDVSGSPGLDELAAGGAGLDGENGGMVFIAAAQMIDVLVAADGGNGGNGQHGYAGSPGRNGFCGPRGFGLAQRGKSGGAGGNAGAGGSGGLITVWYADKTPSFHADEGRPGTAGRGGPGGRGGAGCKGLRGTQNAQSAGNEGHEGHPGTRGQTGEISTRRVDFDDVVDIYEDWLDDGAKPDVLRDRLRMLTTIDG